MKLEQIKKGKTYRGKLSIRRITNIYPTRIDYIQDEFRTGHSSPEQFARWAQEEVTASPEGEKEQA